MILKAVTTFVIQIKTCVVSELGDLGSVPGLGRSPGGGSGNLLQYSRLGNHIDRGAWWATVHGVARVRHHLVTKLPPFYFNKKKALS